MLWRRTAPVQEVGAQIICGSDAVQKAIVRLANKSRLFDDVRIDHGDCWIAIFAAALNEQHDTSELLLPNLGGIALYEDAPGWWLPVGMEVTLPSPARTTMRNGLMSEHDVSVPLIVVPRFDDDATLCDKADIYAIGELMPYGAWRTAA